VARVRSITLHLKVRDNTQDAGGSPDAMNHIMRSLLLLLLLSVTLTLGCGCLPNPQSEWTTSEGGEQRSTMEDPVILSGSTFPEGCNCDTSTVWTHRDHTHIAHHSHASRGSHSGGHHH
jgi:hypothetical protein